MAIVRQTANLTRWNAASSDLDINGVPPNYDIQGKLGSLPPAASRLDFDGSLPSPVNFFSNTNADGFILNVPAQVTQFKSNGQTSRYGFAGVLPSPINSFANTNADGFTLQAPFQVTQFKSNGQTSQFGFPSVLPSPVNYFLNTNSDGFTLNAPFQQTQFKSDGQTSLYGIPGGPTPVNYFTNTNANGFTLNAPSLITQFVGNGQTSLYGIPGGPTPVNYFANTNANGFTLNMPALASDFVGNGQTSLYGFAGALPAPVNYFANTNSAGFTLNMPALASDFVANGQTSLYGFPGALPSPVNYFLNTNASGFTLNAPALASEFVPDSSRYTFPGALPPPVNFFLNTNASGFTLNAPALASEFVPDSSRFTFPGALPPPTNFFLNTNSNGFTLNMPPLVSDFVANGQTSRYGFPGADPAPVNFFLNTNASGFTLHMPLLVSDFIANGQTSLYGFPGALPSPVNWFANTNASGFTLNAPALASEFVSDSSRFTFPGALPSPVDFIFDFYASGFTLNAPFQVTQFLDPGNQSIYGFPGADPTPTNFFLDTHAAGFTLHMPPLVSDFKSNGQTSLYGFAGALPAPVNFFRDDHAYGFTLNMPLLVSDFIANGQTSGYGFPGALPAPVNFFLNTHALGFTLNAPFQVTQFKSNGQTSRFGFAGALPVPVNYFLNTHADGFTLNAPFQVTQFKSNGQTSLYGFAGALPTPVDFFYNFDRKGFMLRQPALQSMYTGIAGSSFSSPRWQTQLGVQNNFIDATSGASGFTLRQALLDTKFIGAGGASYSYPGSVLGRRLWSVSQGPWVGGTAKIESQLGAGSPKFRNTGWTGTSKYAADGQYTSLNAPGNLNTYGVAQLATQYSYSSYYGHELKLRNTAFNPSYIKHPLILRGIQNGTEPQWWGTGAQFEGDPPRGGAVAVANRIVADVERIGKIMISPQGIIWNINQLILAKLNPDSETPASKIRIGPVVLASVAGTALGIHIQSNNLGPEYEEVVKIKNASTGPGNVSGANRLVTLTKSVLDIGAPIIPVAIRGPRATNSRLFTDPYATGLGSIPIPLPAGFFGPPSPPLGLVGRVGWVGTGIAKHYASIPKATTKHLGNGSKLDSLNKDNVAADGTGIKVLHGNLTTPGEHKMNPEWTEQGVVSPGISGPSKVPNVPQSGPSAGVDSGNIFATMPFNQIKSIAAGRNTAHPTNNNNFKAQISGPDADTHSTALVDYNGQSIEQKYGFGRQGQPGNDRSNPYQISLNTSGNGGTVRGDKVNAINYKSTSEDGIYPGNAQDFIKFYFAGINMGIGSDDVVPFRATVKNISDSFNPSWSPINIMGRPDGPALYSSFERSVSFDFMVAAISREELVPMWRKLNYLATFTMPIYGTNSRPQGPIMRLTIGHMYKNLPGYITNLTIGVNEEATWEISSEGGGRQLPNIVDVNCTFNIVHDYRAQKGGAVYSLYDGIYAPKGGGSWIADTTVG